MVCPAKRDTKPPRLGPGQRCRNRSCTVSLTPASWRERTKEESRGHPAPVRAPLLREALGLGGGHWLGTGVTCLPGAELAVHLVPGLQADNCLSTYSPREPVSGDTTDAGVARQGQQPREKATAWNSVLTERDTPRIRSSPNDAAGSALGSHTQLSSQMAAATSPQPEGRKLWVSGTELMPNAWPLGSSASVAYALSSRSSRRPSAT